MELLKNDKILMNMFKLEEFYTIQTNYLTYSITNEMRTKLSNWILDICEEENCTKQVFYLTMNLFDRFMCSLQSSSFNIDKTYVQLFGTCCLFLASKLKLSEPLDSLKLVEYTDNSIRLDELLQSELFILEQLNWDIESIAPNDYLEYLLYRLNLENISNLDLIKRHFYAFTALCSTDLKFSFYPSSMIACGCLMATLRGVSSQLNLNVSKIEHDLINLFDKYSNIDSDCLSLLTNEINELIFKSFEDDIKKAEQKKQEEELKLKSFENKQQIEFEDDYDFNLDYNLNPISEFSTNDSILSDSTNLELNFNSFLSVSPFNSQESNSKSFVMNKKSSENFIGDLSWAESETSDLGSSLNNSNCFLLTPPSANFLSFKS